MFARKSLHLQEHSIHQAILCDERSARPCVPMPRLGFGHRVFECIDESRQV
jgi:hypothetical protein